MDIILQYRGSVPAKVVQTQWLKNGSKLAAVIRQRGSSRTYRGRARRIGINRSSERKAYPTNASHKAHRELYLTFTLLATLAVNLISFLCLTSLDQLLVRGNFLHCIKLLPTAHILHSLGIVDVNYRLALRIFLKLLYRSTTRLLEALSQVFNQDRGSLTTQYHTLSPNYSKENQYPGYSTVYFAVILWVSYVGVSGRHRRRYHNLLRGFSIDSVFSMDSQSTDSGPFNKTMRQRLFEDSSEEDLSTSSMNADSVRDNSLNDPITLPTETISLPPSVRRTSRKWALSVVTSFPPPSSGIEDTYGSSSEATSEAASPIQENREIIDPSISPSDVQYQTHSLDEDDDCNDTYSAKKGKNVSFSFTPKAIAMLGIEDGSPQNVQADHKYPADSTPEFVIAKSNLRKKLSRYFSPSTPTATELPPLPSGKNSGQFDSASPLSPDTYHTPTKKKSFYPRTPPSDPSNKISMLSKKKSPYVISSPIAMSLPPVPSRDTQAVDNIEASPLNATRPTNFRRVHDPEMEKKFLEAGIDPSLINGGLSGDVANMRLVPLQTVQKVMLNLSGDSNYAANAAPKESHGTGDIAFRQDERKQHYVKSEVLPDVFYEGRSEGNKSSLGYQRHMRRNGGVQEQDLLQFAMGGVYSSENDAASRFSSSGVVTSLTGGRLSNSVPRSLPPNIQRASPKDGSYNAMDTSREKFYKGRNEGGISSVGHHQHAQRGVGDDDKPSFPYQDTASESPLFNVHGRTDTVINIGSHDFHGSKGLQQKTTAPGATPPPAGSRGVSSKRSSTNMSGSRKGSSWITPLRGATEPSQQALNQLISQEFARAGVDPKDPDAAAKMKVSTRKLPSYAPSPTSKDPALTKKKKRAGFNDSEHSSPTSVPQRKNGPSLDALSDSEYSQSTDSIARSPGPVLQQASYNPILSSNTSREISRDGSQNIPARTQRPGFGSPEYVARSTYDRHEEIGRSTQINRQRNSPQKPFGSQEHVVRPKYVHHDDINEIGQMDFHRSPNRSLRPVLQTGFSNSAGQSNTSSPTSSRTSGNLDSNPVYEYSTARIVRLNSSGRIQPQDTINLDRYAARDFLSDNTGGRILPGSARPIHREEDGQMNNSSRVYNTAPLSRHSEGHELEKLYPLPTRATSHGTAPRLQTDVERNRNFSYSARPGVIGLGDLSDQIGGDASKRLQPNRSALLLPHQEKLDPFPALAFNNSQQIEAGAYATQGYRYENYMPHTNEKEMVEGEVNVPGLDEEKIEAQDKPKKASFLKIFRKK